MSQFQEKNVENKTNNQLSSPRLVFPCSQSLVADDIRFTVICVRFKPWGEHAYGRGASHGIVTLMVTIYFLPADKKKEM